MLLIYSDNTSPRLQYVCRFIFGELLGITYNITLHRDSFHAHEGPRINYSLQDTDKSYVIRPHQLLFETKLKEYALQAAGKGESAVIFPNKDGDHSFDIFAAVFYLLSRYEEYLPHTKDNYGRYAHENSIAFKQGFLHLPLINIWVNALAEKLKQNFSDLNFQQPNFRFQPTYDIDIAWSYKEKGFLRNAGGFFLSPSIERVATLLGMKEDPFNSYKFLDDLHTLNHLKPLYFFLVAGKNGTYDKNILPLNPAMQKLIKDHAVRYKLGLHPSWKSNEDENILKEEKQMLEEISDQPIGMSRQHYIKMSLPETYQKLIEIGITDEHSMGYGSINGFRASVASSFYWYDLSAEKITSLRVHPFCFMDANCYYEEKLTIEQSYEELMQYYFACKNVGGTLITIFHNNFLGTSSAFKGWRELYTKFISQVQ